MKKVILLCCLSLLLLLLPDRGFGQAITYQPTLVKKPMFFQKTASLKDMPVFKAKQNETEMENEEEMEVENNLNTYEYLHVKPNEFPFAHDPVLQSAVRSKSLLPKMKQNFDGIPQTGWVPADPQGDVGPNHYMQVVNSSFEIWDKKGNSLYGPEDLRTIFGEIPAPWYNSYVGDPVVLYDQNADRWIIEVMCHFNEAPYAILFAVSQTNDPTGAWYTYVYASGNTMNDYPKLAVWPDAYYMSANQFVGNSGVSAYALEREKMITGDPDAQMIFIDVPNSAGYSMLPSDWDGAMLPHSGEPNYFTNFNDYSSQNDLLRIWEYHVDWHDPYNSTFTNVSNLVTEPFNIPYCLNGACSPQPGTTQTLETMSDRLMYRLQYRNFGGYQAMVTNHSVEANEDGRTGIRWYELRKTEGTWSIYQQSTFSPDAKYRWMGSIAMNGSGDIALAYSVSDGVDTYPGIRYTGRLANDPPGQMTISEQTIMDGTGSQPYFRWGDYSMMSIDPTDDATFWYTAEYGYSSYSINWRTRIASFSFDPSAPIADYVANHTTTCMDSTVVFTDLSANDPTAWAWSFSPSSVTYIDGTTGNSQNPHVRFTSNGLYSVTLTASNSLGDNTCTKSNYISILAKAPDFKAQPLEFGNNEQTVFTDVSSCAAASDTYSWNFGAGAIPPTASTKGPHIVSYSSTGQKTISLTINGSVTQTKQNYITVTDPVYTMQNATITTCSGTFYDSGGAFGNYKENEEYTMVFNPSVVGNMLQFVFKGFSLDVSDFLRVYDGINESAPLIGNYGFLNIPTTIKATNASGSLTFVFLSDEVNTRYGWTAEISCNQEVGNPANFVSIPDSYTSIDLSWDKNVVQDDVMIVYSTTPVIGTPTNGTSYGSGNSIPGGGTVLYKGSSNNFHHTSLNNSTTYYYKAFSYTQANNYSIGSSAQATTWCPSISTFPWNEGFENGGTIPGCWSQETTDSNPTSYWTFEAGCWSGYPAEPHSGNYNATFADGANQMKLVSPPLDLTIVKNPMLKFWHVQSTFYNNPDHLSVYYKTSYLAPWILLKTYTENITDWRLDSLALPDPTATYYLAFNGQTFEGSSICLDDVTVYQGVKPLNLSLLVEGLFNGVNLNKAQGANGDQFPGNVADMITVTLYNGTSSCTQVTNPTTIELNTSGNATLWIPEYLKGNYYIAVQHRNSIETWSANPVSFAGDVINYDFTTSANKAYGDNQKLVSGKYVFFAADVNQDGLIDSGDWTLVENDAENFVSGYVSTDINGDGIVDSGDFTLLENNSNDFVQKVVPCNRNLYLTLFLEGLLDTYSMHKAQGAQGDQFPASTADMITVTLVDGQTCAAVANPFPAALQTNGSAAIYVPDNLTGNYYIRINHRNSLETWSSVPVSFSGDNTSYDFSTSASQAYGNNEKSASNKYALFAGDVNQDGLIDAGDWTLVENGVNNFVSGYVSTDINGDGNVDSGDYTILESNSNDFVGLASPCLGDNKQAASYRKLNLTLYPEGLFNGTNLNQAQGTSGNQFPNGVADMIEVTLYDSQSPCVQVAPPFSTELMVNGTCSFALPIELNGTYYISVKHRNSIETWSANPVSFANLSTFFDFTTSASQAYGNNEKLESEKYVFYGGDVNQDGIIDSGDWTLVENDVNNFVSGYVSTDINGDGNVDSGDYTILETNSSGFIGKETPNCTTSLNLTLFLEGLFNGTSMNKAQGENGDQFPGSTADEISIELHQSGFPYNLVAGPYVVNLNTDGTASTTLNVSPGSTYYIVIKHRNSIETWSAQPISIVSNNLSYNFSTSASQAYGNNLKAINNKYVLYVGDIDQDGLIDSSDWGIEENAANAFTIGYIPADLNGDGLVDGSDYTLLENNSSSYISVVKP